MTIRNISQAKSELSALLVLAEQGEEVFIARAGTPIVRLAPVEFGTERRKLGALEGQIWIATDFDAPDPEIEKLFNEGSIEPPD
jgi:antitoxin (DNA-binding transcriptional repressor) of toxin-antitoxin stability system